MKRFNFLSAVIAVVLLVTAVSCTTTTGAQDDYYNDRQARMYGNRILVEDPYRGTIVLERDPWSGRYYEVSPYSAYYGNRYYSRGYGSYRRNNGYYYRGNNNYQRQPQEPTEEQKKQNEERRNEARKKVLGD